MNLASILKMLGVKVAPEHIKTAEELIPKLPGLVNQAVTSINGAMQNFDKRLGTLETKLERIAIAVNAIAERQVNNGSEPRDSYYDGDTRPAGVGATQQLIERTGNGTT